MKATLFQLDYLRGTLIWFVPVITKIVNLSLTIMTFSMLHKYANVTPLLGKKQAWTQNVLRISVQCVTLPFASKIIEKVLPLLYLHDHLPQDILHEPFPSAYRKKDRTETALLRVTSDILHAIDNNHGMFLVLLDLSAAFHTIDRETLLS